MNCLKREELKTSPEKSCRADLVERSVLLTTESVPDSVFLKDKCYEELMEKLKDKNEENKFLKEEERNLKFTIEVLKSYTKVQEVKKKFFKIIKKKI
jgi:hypothetical protein